MKKIVLLSALALAACGPQQSYPQQTQTAQRQQGCDPQYNDCYGYGVGRDSHGDAILAGVVGAGAGYVAGRMSRDRDYDRGYDRSYDHRRYDDDDYGYRRQQQSRTVIVNKHYYNTERPRATNDNYASRSAPVTSAPAPITLPKQRTGFASARSYMGSSSSPSRPTISTPVVRPATRTMGMSARSYRR
jgi:hypothetical protein